MAPTIEKNDHPIGKLASRFYTDKRLIALTLLLVMASGISSYLLLPRMEDPLLTQRAATVTVVYPGADAERVEALVTEKIEDKLLDIPEIKRMRSQSRAGSCFITVELRDDIYDTDPIWSSLRGKLEDSIAELPEGASRPIFDELDISAYAWIGAIVWDRETPMSAGIVRRMARELKDTLFAVNGSKSVDLFGDPGEEIIVELDPDRIAAAGLSANAVAAQLSQRDVKSSAGVVYGQASETTVEMRNQFNSTQEILDATLQTSAPGSTMKLSELATVSRTTPEPPPAKAIIDGKEGVVVSVMLRPEFRIDQWYAAANKELKDFEDRLPDGLKLDVIMEQDAYVQDRMQSLAKNLLLGVSAVALVTLIFMGWRSSLLVTATLPVASLMVIAAMRFMGIPIHQMSITGLIIALGLMIDNAIIAADEVDISLRRGLTPLESVKDMVSRLFAPLLASTVTTALAFAPIALMEGPAGEFVGSIAITVILAIFSSLFLAMTVLPASAALLKRKLANADTKKTEVQHTFFGRMLLHGVQFRPLTIAYEKFLSWLFRRPVLGIVLGSALPIAGFISFSQLEEQFFPPADRDQFYIEVELEPQASMLETQSVALEIDQALDEYERIQRTTWFLGESAPPFYYNVIARRKNSPNYGQAIVTLDSNQDSLQLIRKLQLDLDAQFPSARILVRQLEQGPPFDAPVEIRVFGSDLDKIIEIGDEIRAVATTIPNVLHTRTMLSDTRPTAQLDVRGAETSWAGLSEAQVAQQLFAHLEGVQAGTIIEEIEEIPVRVRVSESRRSNLGNLGETSIMVSAPISRSEALPTVPLSSIADIRLEPERAVITRFNGRRMNEVQSFITAGTLPSAVLSQLADPIEEIKNNKLPVGYKIELGGEASERDDAVARLMANVTVLAVGMVAALVLALSSFRLAGLIGLVATLSIGLGMGALFVFGYPFGFMAIVGTMGLIGIAINDSIVVVAALGHNEDVKAGSVDAAVQTVIEVTRHVLATTFTTVVGFLPLLLSGGGFWPPLAVAIGTGVAGATLISLTLVPSAILLTSKRKAQLAS